MNLFIVNTLTIPSPNASVNRLLSYSKGLVELGDRVSCLSTGIGTDLQEHCLDGITYRMLRKKKGVFQLFLSLCRLINQIAQNKNKIDVCVIVSNSLLLVIPVSIICRVLHIKVVDEVSEYPFVIMRHDLLSRLWSKVYVHNYKLFDGMLIMTDPLVEYYSRFIRKDCKVLKVPMTVDPSRFELNRLSLLQKPEMEYIAYCGDMSGNKDGVMNLIDAFSIVEGKYPNLYLMMIGGTTSPKEYQRITSKVEAIGLKNVLFTGKVDRQQIPELLFNAKLLCLARPSSLQSQGGFPTKLGEYLCTGKPVIITATGEIPRYLNSSNSYIVEPNDNVKFANKILEALSDYSRALIVGANGRKMVEEVFDYHVQAKRMHVFLESLIS